jgi:MFS family permease
VNFRTFVARNARWLLGGLNLTFFSSFGQTFFIALFASQLRTEFDLSHGQFGSVYMLGTLASAITLVFIGKVVDFHSVRNVTTAVILSLAVACISLASAQTLPALLFSIFMLRLAGQGMMTHVAMTAMGRWYVAERGRAISITHTGHQLGEGVLPFIIVMALGLVDWRLIWWGAALTLLLVALPITLTCFQRDRQPSGAESTENLEIGRQWTRAEAVRDIWFWAATIGILAPSFIGTSVWFHQVHLLEIKHWESMVMVLGFTVMSITTVCMTLYTGQLVDRFSAHRMLPAILAPLAVGCVVLAYAKHPGALLLFMFLTGIGYGLYGAIFGALWSEIYGTRHLGAIRSIVFAGMVFSSAVGPGLTGWLLDNNVGFESQLLVMGLVCVFGSIIQIPVSKKLHARVLSTQA